MRHDAFIDDDVLRPESPPHEREALHAEAAGQIIDARDILETDPLRWVRYPWESVHQLTGPIAPGEYHLLVALSGNGKSTFVMNALHGWLTRKRRCYVLGFETDPRVLRLMLAALYLQVDPRLVARLEWTQLPPGTRDQVETHLLMQSEDWYCDLLRFDGSTQVGWRELEATMALAARAGYELFVVDHFDRFDAPSYRDTKRLAEGLKEGAKAHGLAVLCANQVSRVTRGTPAFRRTTPPEIEDVKNGSVVAENCDAMLSIYRPLLPTMTKADRAMVTSGLKSVEDWIDRHAMGLKIVKSRWTSHAGRSVTLRYDQGQLTDPATDALEAMEARYGL